MSGRAVADLLRRRAVLGDGRRRLRFRAGTAAMIVVAVSIALSGCARPQPSPVPAGPIGPIVAQADASTPPVECRGLTRERCLSAGSIEDGVGGIDVADIERVIVSCDSKPCTAAGGAMRIDVLLRDGTTVQVARGGYGDFVQP